MSKLFTKNECYLIYKSKNANSTLVSINNKKKLSKVKKKKQHKLVRFNSYIVVYFVNNNNNKKCKKKKIGKYLIVEISSVVFMYDMYFI